MAGISLSLLANLFGYVRFSDLLAQATLASAYRGIIYYTLALAGGLLISGALQDRTSSQVGPVLSDRAWLRNRLTLTLNLVLAFVWFHTTLNLFGVKTEVYSAIRAGSSIRSRSALCGLPWAM
jgi:hypothetical protein